MPRPRQEVTTSDAADRMLADRSKAGHIKTPSWNDASDPYATCAANHSITSSHGEQHQWYGEAEHMSSLAQVPISLPCWSRKPARWLRACCSG
jgi:transcription elongation factor